MKADLTDDLLFGNEAGEDETPEILADYFVDQPVFRKFYNGENRLSFVRSRKGMGKSALLCHAHSKCDKIDDAIISIYIKASELVALQNSTDSSPAGLINLWQQRICSRINHEIGSKLKTAFADDKIKLVEQAEVAGFRGRNIVGTLIDRLRVKAAGTEIGRVIIQDANQHALLRRHQESHPLRAWVFIDDVDATFLNNEQERIIVSSFFSACRNIVNTVTGLNVRASVRADVWNVIKQYDEALDKCEQYMLDLKWTEHESGEILKKKIITHLKQRYSQDQIEQNQEHIHRIVFQDPMVWNNSPASPFRAIHVLSAGRPRWAAQLCKLAAAHSSGRGYHTITIFNINSVMKEYGDSRLSDLYKEHRHQCPELENLIESFAGGPSIYSTPNLLLHIYDNILPPGKTLMLDGKNQTDKQLPVTHFLYRIGFLNARKQIARGGFVPFDERPHLLTSSVNQDDGHDWEIHPSYRTILRISNSAAEARHKPQNHRQKTRRKRG